LKILYISHLHPPADAPLKNMGGMQRVSLQLVETLKRNSDIELETVKLEAEWGSIGTKTAFFLLETVLKLPKLVSLYNADVILFSSMVTASIAPLIRKKIKIPMVTINHGHDVTLSVRLYQRYLKTVFNSLDGVISVSEATRKASIKRGMDPGKGISLPNGFSPEDFNSGECDKQIARDLLLKKLDLPLNGNKVLLTTGRLIKRKGHEWFISKVLPEIQTEVVYIIVGDGQELDRIRNAVRSSPHIRNIFVLGSQPDNILQLAYCAADLFIMPNIEVPGDMEGFGVVMLEANLMKTPVIGSDLEGIKDVISPGKNGYRVEVGNNKLFAYEIDRVLREELDTLSESSRSYVFSKFTWENVSQRYVEYLKTAIRNFKIT
jgi:phosphatidylinositol alpha-1,6-mannosyltransferase